jgi:hypothetical protein
LDAVAFFGDIKQTAGTAKSINGYSSESGPFLPQTGQFAGKSPEPCSYKPHDDAAPARVVAFSGVFRLNRPDFAIWHL